MWERHPPCETEGWDTAVGIEEEQMGQWWWAIRPFFFLIKKGVINSGKSSLTWYQ